MERAGECGVGSLEAMCGRPGPRGRRPAPEHVHGEQDATGSEPVTQDAADEQPEPPAAARPGVLRGRFPLVSFPYAGGGRLTEAEVTGRVRMPLIRASGLVGWNVCVGGSAPSGRRIAGDRTG